jgi:hypothetical protein
VGILSPQAKQEWKSSIFPWEGPHGKAKILSKLTGVEPSQEVGFRYLISLKVLTLN